SGLYQGFLPDMPSLAVMGFLGTLTVVGVFFVWLVIDAGVVRARLLDPSGLKIDNDVVVYGFDDGVLEMVMIQFVPSPVVTLTPRADGRRAGKARRSEPSPATADESRPQRRRDRHQPATGPRAVR